MSNPRTYAAVGYFFAVLQAVAYSTLGIFGKLVYATGLNAPQTVILRYLATTVILAVVMLVYRKQPLVSRQKSVYLQALFFFISTVFYFFAVERLTAGITTVIFYLFPAVVAVANVFVFKERFSPAIALSLVLAIAGLILVSGITAGDVILDPEGIAFGLVSCVSFAVYTILIQKMGRTEGSLTVTFTLSWTSLIASCIIFAPSIPAMFPLSLEQIALGAAIAALSTIVPILLYIVAIKRIGGTKSSIISISETPFSLLIAFIVLGETLTVTQGVGSCLIVASIAVVTIAPLFKRPRQG